MKLTRLVKNRGSNLRRYTDQPWNDLVPTTTPYQGIPITVHPWSELFLPRSYFQHLPTKAPETDHSRQTT